MEVAQDQIFFVYDYTSFTSSLQEIFNFCEQLAQFFDGYMATFIDTFQGPVRLDIGKVIREWNETCNQGAIFDSGKTCWNRSEEGVEFIVHSCGMLGVPGNISSCTLLHGLHLAVLLESLLVKVVGDDAAGTCSEEDFYDAQALIRNIGICEPSKTVGFRDLSREEGFTSTESRAWHYLKRPINRYDQRIVIGSQAMWPSYGMIERDIPTYRRGVRPSGLKEYQLMVAKMLMSFGQQLNHFPLEDWERALCDKYFSWARQTAKLEVEPDSMGMFVNTYFLYPTDSTTAQSLEGMMSVWSHRIVTYPLEPERQPEENLEFNVKYPLRMSKALRLAVKLGYATAKGRYGRALAKDIPEIFEMMVMKTSTLVLTYEVELFPEIPDWLYELVNNQYVQISPDTVYPILPFMEDLVSSDGEMSD
jgi:hypothetical protein